MCAIPSSSIVNYNVAENVSAEHLTPDHWPGMYSLMRTESYHIKNEHPLAVVELPEDRQDRYLKNPTRSRQNCSVATLRDERKGVPGIWSHVILLGQLTQLTAARS